MGYRILLPSAGLDTARASAEYTAESLLAYPDDAVQRMAGPLEELIAQAETHQAARRKIERAVVRASARVRMGDAAADDEVRELSKDVLGAVRQDRLAPLYVALFPVRPRDIIDMSLGPEMAELSRIHHVLEARSTPAELRKKWSPRIAVVMARGQQALDERTAAAASDAEQSSRTAVWVGQVDRARRIIDGALTSYAAHKSLPPRFKDRFFPPAPQRPARKDRPLPPPQANGA